MKKDKEWLKGRIKGFQEGENMFTAEFNAGVQDALEYVQELIDQVDEPKVLSQEWIDQNHFETENWAEDLYKNDGETIDHTPHIKVIAVQDLQKQNLLVPKPELPTIPKYVADWIERQMKFGYEDVFISMTRLRERAPEKVKFWFHNNPDTYARAWLDGYEVEKEKMYYVRAGNRYVRFNLDGSMIGVRKVNSVVGLERFSKLPFDYKKAVESGIITLEEVTE